MDDHIQEFGSIARDRFVGESPRPLANWPMFETAAASVALGAVFALMAFPAYLIIAFLGDVHFRGWPKGIILVTGLMGVLGGLFVLVAAVFGLIFGILAMGAAKRAGRPVALAFAGVLLNCLDLFMWVGALIAWIITVDSM